LPAQKIQETEAAVSAAALEDSANHWPYDETMMGPILAGQVGFSVHSKAEENGMFLFDPNFGCNTAESRHSRPYIFSNCESHESNINDIGSSLHTTMDASLEKTMDGAIGNDM
jgi:hypothetical protein